MPAYNPPVNGVAYVTYIALQDMANPGSYKANPTIAAGDFQVSIDGGAFANLTTLPTVTPAAGEAVKIPLSAAEMTGDNIFVRCKDQTAVKEWADYAFTIQTVAAGWNVGKTGYSLSPAGVQAIWDALTAALTTAGSIGKLLVDNINATISSRSSHTAADVWASVTRTLTAATNITSTGGTTVPQTGDAFARLGAPAGASVSADIAQVEANVITGLGFVDTEVAAIKAKTDNLPAAPAAVGDIPTAAQNADKLLGRNLAGGSDGGRTVQDALRILRNKRSIAAGTLTVTLEDDTTPAWTAAVTTAASNPVNSIDP